MLRNAAGTSWKLFFMISIFFLFPRKIPSPTQNAFLLTTRDEFHFDGERHFMVVGEDARDARTDSFIYDFVCERK